ncbi:ATP-dependent RNA helicase DHX33-like isoform X2 [Oscarella lobularis]|uniref:ATP-dependent RNA helicase DHX33-like isoform X2 n=1 Tax=Oscarella lobularis TaxID=121494 RepID=UPI003313A947
MHSVYLIKPRRVAATSVAGRVAEEMEVTLGSEVGYSVRFDDKTSPHTAIKYMTDGMLLREAMGDKLLLNYSIIILDEAHERTLHTDILFGIVKGAQNQRAENKSLKNLKILVMSATLDADQFSAYFGSAKVLYVQGRQYPVRILYAAEPQTDYARAAVVTALQIHQEEEPGDILIFLTGQEEIETTERILNDCQQHLDSKYLRLFVCSLYAALPSRLQSKVFHPAPTGHRKVVLSTNIAETSVTIPGIKYVIDTGFVKQRSFHPKSGLELLTVQPVSKAQARQRLGRAGRETSGICYRLFSEATFNSLRAQAIPEIQRCNLSTVILELLALGVSNVVDFDFMDKPPEAAIRAALQLLRTLEAVKGEAQLQLTGTGHCMAQFPLDPKLSKVLLAAESYHCLEEALTIVALMSVDSVLYYPHGEKGDKALAARRRFFSPDGDPITMLNIYHAYRAMKGNRDWCYENFINARNMKSVIDIRTQLRQICTNLKLQLESCHQDTVKLRKSLCAGFFVNAAEYHQDGHYLTADSHQSVFIHPSSCLFHLKPPPQCVIYREIVRTTKSYMRDVCIVDRDWLLEISPTYFKKGKQK